MNIRIGLYDFFSYTIPGGLYFSIGIYLLWANGLVSVDLKALDLSAAMFIILTIISYVLGYIFEPIARLWYKIFAPRKRSEKALDDFKKFHPNLEINFKAADWPILLASVKRDNLDTGFNIEQHNVINLMLRSISLACLIFGIVQIIQFATTSHILYLLYSIFFLISSALTMWQSIIFARYFYLMLFESVAAKSIPIEGLVCYKKIGKTKKGSASRM